LQIDDGIDKSQYGLIGGTPGLSGVGQARAVALSGRAVVQDKMAPIVATAGTSLTSS